MNRRTLLSSGGAVLLAGMTRASFAGAQATPVAAHPDFRVRFVRHAESQINVLSTIEVPGQPLPPDSGVTYPLTQPGVEQAIALGDSLRDDQILAMVSSPRLRCTQTADAIAFAKEMTYELAPGLVEVAFTDPEASMSTVDYATALKTMTSWVLGKTDAHAPGGESLDEVLARFLPVVTETIGQYAEQAGDLLFISHSITISAALPYLFDNLAPAWTLTHVLPNAAIATGGYVDGKLVCTDWNGKKPG